jgi:murein DD-endopeptidase MepM/ murein hydrolase activator NlpD
MRGQAIGEVGHTGLARGDHVHFEWYRNGRPRNPIRLMVGRPDDDPPTQDDVEDLDG